MRTVRASCPLSHRFDLRIHLMHCGSHYLFGIPVRLRVASIFSRSSTPLRHRRSPSAVARSSSGARRTHAVLAGLRRAEIFGSNSVAPAAFALLRELLRLAVDGATAGPLRRQQTLPSATRRLRLHQHCPIRRLARSSTCGSSTPSKEIPKPKPPVECGSCIVGSRQGSTFLKFSGLESCRAWQGTFFYVKNSGRANLINLPPYQEGPPSRTNWSYNPRTDHAETNRVVRFLASLKKETNICSDDIIRTFISRRVLPLKRRAHRMSEMYGPGDPTKITGRPLSKKDVVRKAKQICQTAMPFAWEWGLLPLSSSNPPTQEARDRFPLIQAERRGTFRKRALDSFDPDPYIFWKDLKMGKTPAARLGRDPPEPTGTSDDLTVLIHERVPPLRAEAGSEFVDKLMAQGQKNKQPASTAGSSHAPPSKRFRTEPVGEKEVGVRRYGRKAMPTASGSPHGGGSFLPPEHQDTGASNIGAGEEEAAGRAEPPAPPVLEKTTSAPESSAPEGSNTGASGASTAPPPKPSKLIKGKASDGLQRPFGRPAALVPYISKVTKVRAMKATGLLGRITSSSQGRDLGHLLPYAQKWNAANITPATRGMGKDRLPAPDPVGDRCSEEHFMRLRSAVKELDSAWYDSTNNLTLTADARKALFEELLWEHRELAEAHDKCQVIPEASIDALKEQLAAAQREKDQLSRQHQEELNALKTSYQELKSQLIQLGLDHAKALKAAEVNAAAKLDEALEDACNATVVLRAELEEMAKARKGAEEKAARLEEEHKECDQLILQTDTLAHHEPFFLRPHFLSVIFPSGLFPDSQRYAVKKVDARRKDQGRADLTVPWTPKDHLVALNARVSHMRAIDRTFSDIPR
ncbi:hypothetical protein QYE76_037579 [Lolium multiflorum]|uniref:Uncharacterized protein n=1 Tax=Lolium multiflorum TaxID=4521 RepID=A0AAD8VFA8_LOLMU|nr:hypothetical protein QYE76_037579 [Lolium multiflorum]